MSSQENPAGGKISDPRVFRGIFAELAPQLRNFLYYKCGDTELAGDLCQEAFLRLWNNRDNVQHDKAKSYLFTTANRLFLDHVRHNQVVLKFQQRDHSRTNKESPEYLLEMEEFKGKLERAIAALPEKSREVFLMNRIDKLSYKEIAERLGLSVKAVEKRMGKALKELRKLSDKI